MYYKVPMSTRVCKDDHLFINLLVNSETEHAVVPLAQNVPGEHVRLCVLGRVPGTACHLRRRQQLKRFNFELPEHPRPVLAILIGFLCEN